jgi:hypothetical protein
MGYIGAGIGGMLGGLAGGLFGGGSRPELKIPGPGPELDYNLKALKARSEQSVDDIARGLSTQTEVGQELLGSADDANTASSALGMANRDDMNRVLQERSAKAYDRDLNALQRQIKTESLMKRNDREQQFAAVNNQMRDISQGAAMAADQAEAANQAARNQVIASLFSSAGTLVGAGIAQSGAQKSPAEWTPKQGQNMFDTGYQSKSFGMIK